MNHKSELYTDENLTFNWSLSTVQTGFAFVTLRTKEQDGKTCRNSSVQADQAQEWGKTC